MKRLFYLVVVICLPLMAFFQYRQYQRWHPPTDYHYPISDQIDAAYHDASVVKRYYTLGQQAATLARYAWAEHQIDVKAAAEDDPKAADLVATYQSYLVETRQLEDRLIRSAHLKTQGYDQHFIKLIEQNGWSDEEAKLQALLQNPVIARFGDENDLVFATQQKLMQLGYEMPIDGTYKLETQNGLIAFQTSQSLRATGTLDRQTLLALIKATEKNTTLP